MFMPHTSHRQTRQNRIPGKRILRLLRVFNIISGFILCQANSVKVLFKVKPKHGSCLFSVIEAWNGTYKTKEINW